MLQKILREGRDARVDVLEADAYGVEERRAYWLVVEQTTSREEENTGGDAVVSAGGVMRMRGAVASGKVAHWKWMLSTMMGPACSETRAMRAWTKCYKNTEREGR